MIKVISIGPNDAEIFDEEIGKQPAFVKIYQPWCDFCKKMAEAWENMAETLKNNYTGELSIIEVHGEALDKIKSDVVKTVEGFPTIFEVKMGEIRGDDYSGDRTTDDMLEFIVKRADLKKKSTSNSSQHGGKKKSRRMKKTIRKTIRKKWLRLGLRMAYSHP